MTNVRFRHETAAAARDRADGTGVAFSRPVIGVRQSAPHGRESGVTLLEAIVALAIIALVTAIVVVPVNSYWQRARLETAANEIRAFLQQAQVEAVNQHTPITVTLAQVSGQWVLQLTPPPLHSAATYPMPDFVSLALNPASGAGGWPTIPSTTTRALVCDTLGRTIDPTTGARVTATQTLAITHTRMVDGSLQPNTRFDIQVFPLWNLIVAKVLV